MSVRALVRNHVRNSNPRAGHYRRFYKICPECKAIVGRDSRTGKLGWHTHADTSEGVECAGSFMKWAKVPAASEKQWESTIEALRAKLQLPAKSGPKQVQASLLDLLLLKGG